MTVFINLNRKLQLRTAQINYEPIGTVLAMKLVAVHLPIPQLFSAHDISPRHIVPQRSPFFYFRNSVRELHCQHVLANESRRTSKETLLRETEISSKQ
jgi:hypothetical protein